MLKLVMKSALNRRLSVMLTAITIAICVCLLVGVERMQVQVKSNFNRTISGTDLIIGPRTGSTNLLLYSVFHIGNASNNVTWDTYERFAKSPAVKWAIPISLGDSHRGFRVIGTTNTFFDEYKYGNKQALAFSSGDVLTAMFDVVIGADVAQKLNYKLGSQIVVSHGSGNTSFHNHDALPFKVSGILAKTGTPVDRSVIVSINAIDAIHGNGGQVDADESNHGHDDSNVNEDKHDHGHEDGHAHEDEHSSDDQVEHQAPASVTAAFIGLKSRMGVFQLQRSVNEFAGEPVMAIMPNVALRELWKMMSIAEQALAVIAGFVIVAGLAGMLTTLLASLNERRREMAILRSIGARPWQLFSLLLTEAVLLTFAGIMLGVILLYTLTWLIAPWIQQAYGVVIELSMLTNKEWILLAIVQLSGGVIGILPAIFAYRQTLSDGMTIRL
jgi:putative ABC transport system permease protein